VQPVQAEVIPRSALVLIEDCFRDADSAVPMCGIYCSDIWAWRFDVLAKLVYAFNQSLDGYVDHERFPSRPGLFRHFIEDVRGFEGVVYGHRLYESMRYWDEDHADWDAEKHEYAAAWRTQPKWVVSRSLKSVGPNATLIADNVEGMVRELKAQLAGILEVGGPQLAGTLTTLGLIDEYRIYLHPTVLGSGQPFFSGPILALQLVSTKSMVDGVIQLTYSPAESPGTTTTTPNRFSYNAL